MRTLVTPLAATLIAATTIGSAIAAPLAPAIATGTVELGTVEHVQYGWGQPGYGWRMGPGYYAFGAVPQYRGFVYPGPGWNRGVNDWSRTRLSPQYGSCTGDRENDSAFPQWYCPN